MNIQDIYNSHVNFPFMAACPVCGAWEDEKTSIICSGATCSAHQTDLEKYNLTLEQWKRLPFAGYDNNGDETRYVNR